MRHAETRWLGGHDIALDALLVDAVGSEAISGSGVVDRAGYPRMKAAIGACRRPAAKDEAAGLPAAPSMQMA